MKTIYPFIILLVVMSIPLAAQDSKPLDSRNLQAVRERVRKGDTWTDALTDRSKRGTLYDSFQYVRGDSGKWSDQPVLLHAPAIGQKPVRVTLDDWADQLLETEFKVTSDQDNWLLLRTRQLDDNDRVWIERIERRDSQVTIVVHEAVWQGRYSKTFTYYSVFGVNLGQLATGTYQAKCIIKPLVFTQFDGNGQPRDNSSKDERPADKNPTELHATFRVAAAAR